MKKIIYVIGLSFALLFTGVASAETKIAVVDIMSVIQRMPQREAVGKTLESEFGTRAKSLQADEQKANDAAGRLKKDGLTLSSSEKSKLNKTITDFQTKAQAFSVDSRKRENEELEKLMGKVVTAAQDLAKAESYDLVLPKNAAIYSSDAIDITEKVLEKVKK